MALRLTVLCASKFRQLKPILYSAYNQNVVPRPRCAEMSFFSFGQTDKQKKCPEMGENKIVDYAQVKDATKNNTIYIIDVREPHELQETGEIPNSLNIPLGEVADVLKNTSDDVFKTKYGKSKPDHCAPLIFTCRSGKRATTAAEMAEQIGFENSKIYYGSWLDWESHLKDQ